MSKTIINLPDRQAGQPPTESRRFTFLINFKDRKRIRWATPKEYLH
ncbi:hypothetical protein ACFQZJ_07070 [Maribacter chungangensis]|uniref:Uncharacterized protein n=1 Tax=Maribacter chungangensis TaxID=1069117 RepID=A0ABW3B2I6_9FLAO